VTHIPFLRVRLPEPDAVARDYEEIFAAGVFTNSGPFERRFAAEIAQWIGNNVAVGSALDAADIGWRAYFERPVHKQPSFAGVATAGPLDVTEDIAARILSLPLDDELQASDVTRVADVIARVVDG
jgi:dTDP-4-amino-4,6-dideoxygalactose transaminase